MTATTVSAQEKSIRDLAVQLGFKSRTSRDFTEQWEKLTVDERAELLAALPQPVRTRAPRAPKPPVFPVTVSTVSE